MLELLEAWRLLQPSDALLVMAGPDMTGHAWDAGAPGRAFVEQHGLGDRVRFVGPLADVAPMIKAADLVVQPSHFEALGLSAIEALACGVPLVASAVGGPARLRRRRRERPPLSASGSAGAGGLHRRRCCRTPTRERGWRHARATRCGRSTTSWSSSGGCARCSSASRRRDERQQRPPVVPRGAAATRR